MRSFSNVTAIMMLMAWTADVEAVTITDVGFSTVADDSAATQVIFDEYVSNPQPSESAVNGTIESFTSPFDGFANPSSANTTASPLPSPVDFLVEDSTGTVEFLDGTGLQITSDLLHPGSGETLSFRFGSAAHRATVSGFALRFGSTADSITASFYDPHDNLLGTGAVSAGTSVSEGWQALDSGLPVSIIHRIDISTTGSDAFVVGSFTLDPATTTDLAFTGFEGPPPAPEPSTLLLIGVGFVSLVGRHRQRRRNRRVRNH